MEVSIPGEVRGLTAVGCLAQVAQHTPVPQFSGGGGGSVAGVTDYCLQSKTDQADEASRLESLKGSENTLARGETQTTQLSVPLSVNVDNEL